jgi:hypothetical protein
LQQRYGSAVGGAALTRALPPVAREAQLVTKKGNPPLGFSLRLDPSHPYLAARGIERSTASYFGAGFCGGSGLMSGRIAIPIHDSAGQLIAYAGRAVAVDGPRYRFPAGFQKSQALFNYHRARPSGSGCAIVVEGFFDCMRVHQAGFPNVVGLMGAVLSETQKELLATGFRRIILMLDGDATGRRATAQIAAALRPACTVIEVPLPTGWQPDQMTTEQVRDLLAGERRRGSQPTDTLSLFSAC